MLNLNEYIRESILDDEDKVWSNSKVNILNDEIQKLLGGDYEVTNDEKYIIYKYLRSNLVFGSPHIPSNSLDKINNYGLKFQPFKKIFIYDDGNLQKFIDKIPSAGCGHLYISNDHKGNINLSKLNITTIYLEYVSNHWDITPPKKHIKYAYIDKYVYDKDNSDWENIKGWDCDVLMIYSGQFELWDNNKHILGDFDLNMLQTLVDNNPKAKEILLVNHMFGLEVFKVGISGAKRKVTKIIKKTPKYLDKLYADVDIYNETMVRDFEKKYMLNEKPIKLYT